MILRTCPTCEGRGYLGVGATQGAQEPPCPTCHGTSFVCPESICVCGATANLEYEKILSCGREMCLNTLKARQGSQGNAMVSL